MAITRLTSRSNVTHLLSALHERYGLDREVLAAMAFERSRQHNVTLIQGFADLVAELDQVLAQDGVELTGRVFRSAKDVADAMVEHRRPQPQRLKTK